MPQKHSNTVICLTNNLYQSVEREAALPVINLSLFDVMVISF